MNKDRGMIKWMPFNSVINTKEVLSSILKEKARKRKPIISDDEIKQLEKSIIDAFYMQTTISITYYKGGYTYKYTGKIKKIDSINKLIYLNNLKLLFNQIIDVKDFYDGNCSLG